MFVILFNEVLAELGSLCLLRSSPRRVELDCSSYQTSGETLVGHQEYLLLAQTFVFCLFLFSEFVESRRRLHPRLGPNICLG